MTKFGIGQAVPRLEDPALITGRGQFTDDISLPNQAHLFVLRSPHAHARIARIDGAAARAAPGVLLVLTGEDVERDRIGDIPCLIPLKSRDGTPRHETPRPVLARGRVRHVGEPVAAVVADTLVQARDAAELIEVEYETLPVAIDTVEATKDGQPRVWEHIAGNLAFDWETGDAAAVEAAFAAAAHVTRIRLVNNRIVCNAMEPRAAVGDFDAASGRTTLYAGSQSTHLLRDQMAEHVFKEEIARHRVITPDVGGGFGMKAFFFPEYAHVTWAARKLRRPVKWTSDRSEGFLSDGQGRDNVTFAELALDDDARFLGLRVTTYGNLGAYQSNYGPVIITNAGTAMLAGVYTTPAIHVNVKGVLTNTLQVDAYRGAGRPEAIYVIERVVDKAARELRLAPDEIRRRNMIPPDAMPYTTALGRTYDSGEFVAAMEEAMRRADWAGFEQRRADAARRGRLRGIGMAYYVETCGGGSPETAKLRFDDDGTLTVLIGNPTNGQGHLTSYAQILSGRLGIDAERVRLIQGDSDLVEFGMTGGSRSQPVGGAAVQAAADKVIAKGKEIAAHLLETASADVAFAEGRFTVVGTDRALDLFEVARAAKDPARVPPGMAPGLDEQHKQVPEQPTFPNGCHIAEVEIEPETGRITILRWTLVDDFGDIINPLLLAGQIHGGLVQGLGQALTERTVYDEASGQLLTGSLMDYALPRADDVPSFELHYRNVRCRTNPLGIKGAGEAGTIAAAPTVMNAIVDALMPSCGIVDVDMPAVPLRIWQLLRQHRAAA